MDDLTTVLSILAMLGCGMIGGVFFAFSSFVMRALARLPDAQGLAAMQSINFVVLNWHFLGMVTARGNVPLNNALVGVAPESRDAAVEWKRYLERWTRWNHVRTGAAAAAAVLHALAIAV